MCCLRPLPATVLLCLQGASKAKEFTSTLARGPREYLVAVRSEGQFVGEMASFTTAAVRCATVRAKGNVRVRLIPGELLHDCVERIPEVGCSPLHWPQRQSTHSFSLKRA